MNTFINSRFSRETSIEVMKAIESMATNDEDAVEIWRDPTIKQVREIWKIVTKNGKILPSEFCWGAACDRWYEPCADNNE